RTHVRADVPKPLPSGWPGPGRSDDPCTRENPVMGQVRAAWTRRLAGLGMAAAAALALATVTAPPSLANGEILGAGNQNAIKDSYIVIFKDNAAQGVQALTDGLARQANAKVSYTYQHALRGFAGSMSERAARALAANPAVAYVEQNGTVQLAATQPNPPSWGLDRIDQRDLPLDSSYTYPNDGAGVR